MFADTFRRRITALTVVNPDSKTELLVELADNPLKRALGLMFRKKLEYDGMLFAFDRSACYCFWMVFTGIPLDAIFISEHGVVTEVMQLKPYSLEKKCPAMPAKYVLEVRHGSIKPIQGMTKVIFVKN